MNLRNCFVCGVAALIVSLALNAEASAQVKVTITPKVSTSNVTKNSCKAQLTVTVTAVEQTTKQRLFTHTYKTAKVTLPKNVEITFPAPPPPKIPNVTVSFTTRARFTGTAVSGSAHAQVKVGPPINKSVTASKSFSDSVSVN